MSSSLNNFATSLPVSEVRKMAEAYVDKMIDEKLCDMLIEIKEEIKKDVMRKLGFFFHS